MDRAILILVSILIGFLPLSVYDAHAAPIEFIITDTFPTEFYPSETIDFNITIKKY